MGAVNRWLVIGGISLVVLMLAKRIQAAPGNPYDVRNWETMPAYRAGTGLWV